MTLTFQSGISLLALALLWGCGSESEGTANSGGGGSSAAGGSGGTSSGASGSGASGGGGHAGTGGVGATGGAGASAGQGSGGSSTGGAAGMPGAGTGGMPSGGVGGTLSGGGAAGLSGAGGGASGGSSGAGGAASGGSSGAGTAGVGGGSSTACDFSESFSLPDGSAWPAVWVATGGVALADVQAGRGRLVPIVSGYSLARVFAPLPASCREAEVTASFEFAAANTQGFGVYLRQNMGYLGDTNPPGQGYGSFAEAFRSPSGLGLWREIGGSEELLGAVEPVAVASGVVYRMRYQVEQTSALETTLRSKMWLASASEPQPWTVTRTENTASLQNVPGGLVLDAWSTLISGPTDPIPADLFIDDVRVRPLP